MTTIAAPASGIAVIRLSGNRAIEIVSKIFRSKSTLTDHSIIYGKIYETKENGQDSFVDEVLISYMKAPRSYTKEDVIEIYSHSNFFIVSKIYKLLIENGAREAEQGEFTKRAFLNGRIDLTQAESVINLINASSEKSVEASLKHLSGMLKSSVNSIRKRLLDFISHCNALADYPEEVEEEIEYGEVKRILKEVDMILDSYQTGKKIKSGASVAIIGKPNVGKSTLMNRLLKSDRALVSHIAGTTRDIVTDTFFLKGLAVHLLDTAGIRKSRNLVEKMGIELSKKAMSEADLILLVFDSSKDLDSDDRKLLKEIEHKNHLVILNKQDKYIADMKRDMNHDLLVDSLNSKGIDKEKRDTNWHINGNMNTSNGNMDNLEEFVKEINSIPNSIKISARSDLSLSNLEELIFEKLFGKNFQADKLLLDNARHRELFAKISEVLNQFLSSSAPLDIRSIYISSALDFLGEIIGEITNEDILDNIFKNFCLGK